MGIFTGLLTLPLAPVRGVVWVAEMIGDQADQQLHDPAVIRRRLALVEEAHEAGELSDEDAAETEEELLAQMMTGHRGEPSE